jgi:hypothetical protein
MPVAPPRAAPAASAAAVSAAPVVSVASHAVFGVRDAWCIVTCPVCDGDGFVQEDVHALPPAPSTCCAYGHAYHIKLERHKRP